LKGSWQNARGFVDSLGNRSDGQLEYSRKPFFSPAHEYKKRLPKDATVILLLLAFSGNTAQL
jgi:hypothetical protein